jgi:hypothetical protein
VEVAISFAVIVEQVARRFRLPQTKEGNPLFAADFADERRSKAKAFAKIGKA